MTEMAIIQRTEQPRTRSSIAADLRGLGLAPGSTVLVHSSLSALGWVSGGQVAVIQALLDVLGVDGTLAMPAHSSDNSDPVNWQHPPVPETWIEVIRASMPAFDPAITPTRRMGAIAELFRTWPGAMRSNHPSHSFSALGKHAAEITAPVRQPTFAFGEQSALARLYDLDAQVLLLGVGFANNTAFHLGEARSGVRDLTTSGAAFYRDGQRVWEHFDEIDYDDERFPEIGAEFEQTGRVRVGSVGNAESRLFSMRGAVDFAEQWLRRVTRMDYTK